MSDSEASAPVAQSAPPSSRRRRHGGPSSDVYTVLALIALVALLFGIGVIWFYSQQLFGTQHPFEVVERVHVSRATSSGGGRTT